jgi:hypothetical protein
MLRIKLSTKRISEAPAVALKELVRCRVDFLRYVSLVMQLPYGWRSPILLYEIL